MTRPRHLYSEVRDRMKPGDVVAFGGKGAFSGIIKNVTRAPVSHVGIIRHSQLRDEAGTEASRYFNEITESTSLNGFVGVTTSRLSARLRAYEGEVWWLPLSAKARSAFDGARYFNWLYEQEGKPYDTPQAIQSALDLLDSVPLIGGATLATEDFTKLFCSELAAGALQAAGVLPDAVNASECTPIDLCRVAIYAPTCVQLQPDSGDVVAIPGFNRTPVEAMP